MIRQRGKTDKNPQVFARKLQEKLNTAADNAKNNGRCPHPDCRGYGLIKWGRYPRTIRVACAFGQTSVTVKVPRLRCPHCQRTHAVIAEGTVPYRWYSLLFILRIVATGLRGTKGIRTLCDRFEISVSTYYRWLDAALRHFSVLRGILLATARNLIRAASRPDWQLLDDSLVRYDQVYMEHIR